MIEAMDFRGGAGRANIICDDCGQSETVPCAYINKGNGNERKGQPNVSQARARALAMGWEYVKSKLRCPQCKAKKRVTKEETTMKAEVKVAVEAATEPTKAQKREIMGMLEVSYDTEAERYIGGDTDDTVAAALGVMPGWVAALRDEFFGPAGGNEDMDALAKEIAQIRTDAAAMIKRNTDETDRLMGIIARAKEAGAQLDRIKKAVGARTMKKCGITE